MKKKILLLIALIEVVVLLSGCASTKSTSENKYLTSESNKVVKDDQIEEKHNPNRVVIFDGKKVQDFAFVYYTISGEIGEEKIIFTKEDVIIEDGMNCPIPGEETPEFDLKECYFYYYPFGQTSIYVSFDTKLLRSIIR